MSDEKKRRSWLGKLRSTKSSCCNVVIEEIADDGEQPSCCGGSMEKKEAGADETQQ